MPREAGYYDFDGGLVVLRSLQDQPPEAFEAAFKQYLVKQKPLGFSVEKVAGTEPSGLLHEARQFVKGMRQTATSAISKVTGQTAAEIVNPVPGTMTDAGQLGGAGLGMLIGSLGGPPGIALGGLLGGTLGRVGGNLTEEKPQPYTEGAMGLVSSFAPQTLRGASMGARTVAARAGEKKLVGGVLDELQNFLPSGAPRLSKDIGRFQQQMSATGKHSLSKWAASQFRDEIDQINAAVGHIQVRIPSLSGGPVKISDVIEAVSEKGQRLIAGQEPKTFSQKVAAVGREKVLEELDFVLRSNGLDAVADGYVKARNNMFRTNEIVRLFTKAAESRRPLDLAEGKIDLSKLQQQFLKMREQGGLKPFTAAELEALERKLGRGSELVGVDKPMNLPGLVTVGVAPGRSTGLRIAAPSIPRAAGVRYNSPSIPERLLIPSMLGQQFTGAFSDE